MADRILIDINEYAKIAGGLQALAERLSDCAADIGGIRPEEESGANLRVNVSAGLTCVSGKLGADDVAACLAQLQKAAAGLGGYTRELKARVDAACGLFETTEQGLARAPLSVCVPAPYSLAAAVHNAVGGFLDYSGPQNQWTDVMWGQYQSLLEKIRVITEENAAVLIGGSFIQLLLDGLPIGQAAVDTSSGLTESLFIGLGTSQTESSLGVEIKGEKKLWKYQSGEESGKKDSVSPLKDRLSLLTVAGKAGYTNSAFLVSKSESDGKTSRDSEVGLFKFSAEAGGSAGLFAAETDNGKGGKQYVFSPGAGAKLGASFAVIDAQTSTNYEIIDNVTLKSSLGSRVGAVDVNGEGQLGFVDGDFAVYGKAEAEAIAAEISGDVGINIAGIEGSIGGSVNYGVGAHAEAGYKDGVVKVDVGVSVGVGASLSAQVDVSGVVDPIVKGAAYVAEGAENAARWAGQRLYEGGTALKGAAESVWQFFS